MDIKNRSVASAFKSILRIPSVVVFATVLCITSGCSGEDLRTCDGMNTYTPAPTEDIAKTEEIKATPTPEINTEKNNADKTPDQQEGNAPVNDDKADTSMDDKETPLIMTYLGVKDYGAPETNRENMDHFVYRFLHDGVEELYLIDNGEKDKDGKYSYPVQNKLKEGYSYEVSLKKNGSDSGNATYLIYDVTELPRDDSAVIDPKVKGEPGVKTLENFLKTALSPVGTVLYVYGGGWDWQDEGGSVQTVSFGLSESWVRFFNEHDESYYYKNIDDNVTKKDPATSYYPYGEYNEYYYAGLDCSGYLGWVLYNTLESEENGTSYVGSSTKFAKRLADLGFGDHSRDVEYMVATRGVRPGDIMSISGHVWISLGTCRDGSIVIVHSTPGAKSRNKGQTGGGVQISAIGESKECEAYKLADTYMSKYYPEWYSRYPVYLCDPSVYMSLLNENAGRFRWNTESGVLTDKKGIADMKPQELLKRLFNE